jgi:hypothetical protein
MKLDSQPDGISMLLMYRTFIISVPIVGRTRGVCVTIALLQVGTPESREHCLEGPESHAFGILIAHNLIQRNEVWVVPRRQEMSLCVGSRKSLGLTTCKSPSR